jgi:hypothetical protein
VEVEVTDHFYTTDFFVPSAFDADSQMISIYYLCTCHDWQHISVSSRKFDYVSIGGRDAESFRWVHISDLRHETDVHLPIDKVVLNMLIEMAAGPQTTHHGIDPSSVVHRPSSIVKKLL